MLSTVYCDNDIVFIYACLRPSYSVNAMLREIPRLCCKTLGLILSTLQMYGPNVYMCAMLLFAFGKKNQSFDNIQWFQFYHSFL